MNTFIRGAQVFIIVSTLIYCYRKRHKIEINEYMKNFYWYPLVGSCIGLIWFLGIMKLVPESLFNYLNALSLIFHFSFLSGFIFKVVHNKAFQIYLLMIFWTFQILIAFFLFRDFYSNASTAFVLTNLGLFLFCMVFYCDLFNYIPTYSLFKEPSFWIITGIFCGACFNIPILLFGKHLFDISKDLYRTVGWLAPFGYIVMYLFFLKGLRCSIPIPKK